MTIKILGQMPGVNDIGKVRVSYVEEYNSPYTITYVKKDGTTVMEVTGCTRGVALTLDQIRGLYFMALNHEGLSE